MAHLNKSHKVPMWDSLIH